MASMWTRSNCVATTPQVAKSSHGLHVQRSVDRQPQLRKQPCFQALPQRSVSPCATSRLSKHPTLRSTTLSLAVSDRQRKILKFKLGVGAVVVVTKRARAAPHALPCARKFCDTLLRPSTSYVSSVTLMMHTSFGPGLSATPSLHAAPEGSCAFSWRRPLAVFINLANR